MRTVRPLPLLLLAILFVSVTPVAFGQQVIATVPVGSFPQGAAVNASTNKIYVVNNFCGQNPCATPGTVTVINGADNTTQTVNVGYFPDAVVVNPVSNKIYVTNGCGTDPNCAGIGTMSVIDGVTLAVTPVVVQNFPYGLAVNSLTNKIYVTNVCGADPNCASDGTISVIDGNTNAVVDTIAVGANPFSPVINATTNQIYVPNNCGNDPSCVTFSGTVTVINGADDTTQTVVVGFSPDAADVNAATNKIYVANQCGNDSSCASKGTVTVIDGATLTTLTVNLGGYQPFSVAVNPMTNQIYAPSDCFSDPSCPGSYGTLTVIDGGNLATANASVGTSPDTIAINATTNKIYVANECGIDPNCVDGTVTVIDGVTLAITNLDVGPVPYGLAVNPSTNLVYVPNYGGNTASVINGTPPTALQFVPLSQPCRAVDTRNPGGNGPIQGGTFQNFAISGSPACGTLPAAAAYSMNVTVVPQASLSYLTVWPTGQAQPLVSTLNSTDGRVKADAAITPAGTNGQISIYATDTTNVIVDVDGYFAPVTSSTLAFYPLPPCRVADTRQDTFPQGLGTPFLTGGAQRDFPILNATTCNIPPSAAAYSLNFTVIPHGALFFLTAWPTGQPQPNVSTLNDANGQTIANAAIVVAGQGSAVSVYPTNDTDLVIDIDGYFAAADPTGLSLYNVGPCRVIDTRNVGSGLPFTGTLAPAVDVVDAGCGASSTAQAYVFNTTVVPDGALNYLTLWPDNLGQPLVSTLNAFDGSVTNNMAIVPTKYGAINAYANGMTQLILDISSYFAP